MYRTHKCKWKLKDFVHLFELLLRNPTLKRISGVILTLPWGWCADPSIVDPGLLVKVFARLEELHLTFLTPEQYEQFFSAVAEGKCALKVLRLEGVKT